MYDCPLVDVILSRVDVHPLSLVGLDLLFDWNYSDVIGVILELLVLLLNIYYDYYSLVWYSPYLMWYCP